MFDDLDCPDPPHPGPEARWAVAERVRRRAARRRGAWLGAVALAATVTLTAGALVAFGASRPISVASHRPDRGTPSDTATTAPPPTSTSTTTGGVTAPPTVTASAATVPTAPPLPPTFPSPSSTTQPASPACTTSDLTYTTVTDRSTYPQGTVVRISLIIRNQSNHPCDSPPRCGLQGAVVTDAAGTEVWRPPPAMGFCPPSSDGRGPPPAHYGPGQSSDYGGPAWHQDQCSDTSCTHKPVPPGTYRAATDRRAAPATFEITSTGSPTTTTAPTSTTPRP